MKEIYLFEYVNENEFHKLERSLKKYNMLAYKKLCFEYYPKMKEGTFLGKEVATNSENNTVSYELKLPTDAMFAKVHGDIIVKYIVYKNERMIMLDTIEPIEILTEVLFLTIFITSPFLSVFYIIPSKLSFVNNYFIVFR